jgi:AmmeMemoRadiSam system protein A
MPSPDPNRPEPAPLEPTERRLLIELAWVSIRHGLEKGVPVEVDPEIYPPRLHEPGAAFVTLHRQGRLRGCIGHLTATCPLVEDVAENAFAAAFRDPRFPALEEWEVKDLDLEISVLSRPEPMSVRDEADLLGQLRPGIDGLILEDRGARGTFLPTVWESLPKPRDFLAELRRKAGLPPGHWSGTLKVSRYRTETFGA